MGIQDQNLQLEAEEKIEEAKYFLELLARIETQAQSLTKRALELEATYLTSALMSACASALSQVEGEVKRRVRKNKKITSDSKKKAEKEVHGAVEKFKVDRPEVKKLRDVSVHECSVPTEQQSRGGWGESWGEPWGGRTEFCFSDPPQEPVIETFSNCIRDLEQLVREWRGKLKALIQT